MGTEPRYFFVEGLSATTLEDVQSLRIVFLDLGMKEVSQILSDWKISGISAWDMEASESTVPTSFLYRTLTH